MVAGRVAAHAVDFWLSTEYLPKPDNRVTVTKNGEIKLSYTPTNEVPKKKLYHVLEALLDQIGMIRSIPFRAIYI